MDIVVILTLIIASEAAAPIWYSGGRCGISKYADAGNRAHSSPSVALQIAGGKTPRRYEFPWVAGLARSYSRNLIFCGGTVINERWILTAAHCLEEIPNRRNRILVVVGEYRTFRNNTERRWHNVSRYFLAPNYNADDLSNDTALLKLETDIIMTENVAPICAPDPDDLYIHRRCVVAGWGRLANNKFSSMALRYVWLNITTNEECGAIIAPEPITPDMMCATDNEGDIKRSPCDGDSGGPVAVKDAYGAFTIVGIHSWVHDNCTMGYPSGQSRVGYFASWITETVRNN